MREGSRNREIFTLNTHASGRGGPEARSTGCAEHMWSPQPCWEWELSTEPGVALKYQSGVAQITKKERHLLALRVAALAMV